MVRMLIAALALAAAAPASAAPVPVRVVWDGNDAVGAVLVNRVRGLIAGSADKREVLDQERGLAVLVQTIDPATEFATGLGRKPQMTVYSLVINVRPGDGSADTFATAALGYCAFPDIASCSREIVDAIDEEIAKRKLG